MTELNSTELNYAIESRNSKFLWNKVTKDLNIESTIVKLLEDNLEENPNNHEYGEYLFIYLFGSALKLEGSSFPDQGSKPRPCCEIRESSPPDCQWMPFSIQHCKKDP